VEKDRTSHSPRGRPCLEENDKLAIALGLFFWKPRAHELGSKARKCAAACSGNSALKYTSLML
jgi:hypothetical protein